MKSIAKKILRATGADSYFNGYFSNIVHSSHHALSFQQVDADLVFDIGANQGQFAKDLIAAGFIGNVVSFEPLSAAHRQLVRNSGAYTNWIAHTRCAIGDYNGIIDINISKNSMSSSILAMGDSHLSAAEESIYVANERAPIFTLDAVGLPYANSDSSIILKIDTQGFEWQVLDGAAKILPLVRGVLCELSLIELYKDQRLWKDMIERLEKEGFKLWSIQQGFVDQRTARTLQIDATFLRV